MKRLMIAVVILFACSLRGDDANSEFKQISRHIEVASQVIKIQTDVIVDDTEMVTKLIGLNNPEVNAIINPHISFLKLSVKKIGIIQKKNWPSQK